MRDPVDRWDPETEVHLTDGPHRIYDTDEAGPPARFLGFAPTPERDPITWDGDQA